MFETNTNSSSNSMNNLDQSNHCSFELTYPNSKTDVSIFGFSVTAYINEASSISDH